MDDEEKKKFISSTFFPLAFVALLWLIKFIEIGFETSFAKYGLLPKSFTGLPGIITSPLIHGDFSHLISNSLPLLVLGFIPFYFYRPIAFTIF